MRNPLIGLGAAVVVFGIVALSVTPIAAVVPALMAGLITFGVLGYRTGKAVQAEMEQVVGLLQMQNQAGARQKLLDIQARYSNHQPLIGGQVAAQLGMMDYVQMKWDVALPNLMKGKWRNWAALVCIAGVHHRKGDLEKTWEFLEKARKASKKEPMVYLVHAVLLTRGEQREEALGVLAVGLENLPDSKLLKELRNTIANKKRVDVSKFPQSWYQFFPEDYAQRMAGRMQGVRPGGNFPQPRMSKRMRRGK